MQFILCDFSYSQLFYNNGAPIHFNSGSIVRIKGTFSNNNSGALDNDGNLTIDNDIINNATINGNGTYKISGNWINNQTFTAEASAVYLEGANQQISGTAITSFNNLTLTGTGIKTQAIDSRIQGILALNDRELATDSYTMFVENTNPNAITRTTGFVSSLGNGKLSRSTANNTIYLFPTGSSLGILRYRPVEITPATSNANTYTVRMANVDATTEGYDRSLMDTGICLANPLFYHRINRTSGSTPANISIYFDETADGFWNGIAQWETIPSVLWKDIGTITLTPGSPLNYIAKLNWNDFSSDPYILIFQSILINLGQDTAICPGNSISLDAGSGFITYQWSTGETTPSITADTSGIFSVTVTNDVGCIGIDTIIININQGQNATIAPAGPFCLNNASINLTAVTGGGIWSGTGITNSSFGTFSPSIAGIGIHQIIYTISGTCGDADTISITVNQNYNATITPTGPFCLNNASINFTAVTGGGVWSGTGITNSSFGTFSPSIAGIGTHQIIYTISGTCGDADTAFIIVHSVPVITMTPSAISCIDAHDGAIEVTINNGTSPCTYLWSTGDTTKNIISLSAGIYSLTVNDFNDCSSFANSEVLTSDILCYPSIFFIPNTFSPNNDGKNDVLYVRGGGIKYFEFTIYDRWGKEIFKSNEQNTGWDGCYDGTPMNAAVFVYTLKGEMISGSIIEEKGNVTLMR
ncbi:MAG: gliding motility-associated C-terminal domain-containing protein [Bacteroidia bacterium]|nr:gliding motility-associated C-terminal domain-containing protein [Bacteroidia bacterium]